MLHNDQLEDDLGEEGGDDRLRSRQANPYTCKAYSRDAGP